MNGTTWTIASDGRGNRSAQRRRMRKRQQRAKRKRAMVKHSRRVNR